MNIWKRIRPGLYRGDFTDGRDMLIERKKRKWVVIAHVVSCSGYEIAEFQTLKLAKEYAEFWRRGE